MRSVLTAGLAFVLIGAPQTAPPPPVQAPPPAQNPQQNPQQPIFRDAIDVIRLDVSVLDKDRRPVRGLTAENFTVFENGREQRIVAVAEIDGADHDPAPSAWMKHVPRDVAANDLNDQLGDGRLFAIVLDDVNVPWDDLDIIRQARESARYVIDALGPSDLAAVVYPRDAGKSQDFTDDRRRLVQAIDRFDPREPDRWLPAGPTNYRPGPGGGDMPQRFSPVLSHSNCDLRQLVVPALETVVARMASVPNRRKTVIFVSTGVPISFSSREECMSLLADRMVDTFRRAQRATINMYSIDPGGYRGYENYLQDPIRRSGRPAERVATEAGADASARFRRDFLKIMADYTGAQAITNTDEVEAGIERIFIEDAFYYLVGYQTSNGKPDGKFRRIEVKVDHPGVTVRTRSGYFAPKESELRSREARDAPATSTLNLVGLGNRPGLPLRATATVVGPTGNGREVDVAIVLTVRLPPLRSQQPERVTVTRHVYDERGNPGPPAVDTSTLDVAPAGGDDVRYDLFYRMALEPGRYDLRLHAQSDAMASFGSVYVPVEVPDLSGGQPAMTGIVVGLPIDDGDAGATALTGLVPVRPTSAREFSANESPVAVAWLFATGQATHGPAALVAQVLDAGDRIRAEETWTVAPDAFGHPRGAELRIPLPLDGLEHGPYLLSLQATLADGSRVRRDLVFRVR